MLEDWRGTDCSISDMLNVPGMNTFLKLEEQAKKEAKPVGLSKSHDMKTGWISLPLSLDSTESQRSSLLVTSSLLVMLIASLPPL